MSGTILLVDDDNLDLELARQCFRRAGLHDVTLRVAAGGVAGLDYLFGRGAYADRERNPLPDLVLLDLKMPAVNGHEVLRQVKAAPVLKRTPVVILSNSSDERDLASCYDNGANAYIMKPVDVERFVAMLQTLSAFWLHLNVRPSKR